ncbi:MAG: monovalent cation/H(+) antiporter subunit G [bacterium]|nr:monovalent cation/H(+) antiporter subunit G [bacterium]
MSELDELVASVLLLVGLFFTLVGSIGLVRLPDFYTRMHAPTKAATLGVSTMLAAVVVALPERSPSVAFQAALAIVLLFVTAPIGAHMLARAARGAGVRACPETHVDELPPAEPERAGEGPAGR